MIPLAAAGVVALRNIYPVTLGRMSELLSLHCLPL